MRVLCVYSTRQIDSNLFMSSTKFEGLKKCGYNVDLVFCGTDSVCEIFNQRYGHFFNRICYLYLKESYIAMEMVKHERSRVLYRYYREILRDPICPPITDKHRKQLRSFFNTNYDVILTFIPNALGGILANYIHNTFYPQIKLTQFWTDPISLSRCDTIDEISKTRWLHRIVEKRMMGLADKMIFCYPLLCESMKALYPQFADKMTWGDTSFVKHEKANFKPNNEKVTIGCFGAYQKRVRNIEPLLGSMGYFPEVQFIIRGDTDVLIDSNNYPNLDVEVGRLPVNVVEEMEANCDILLCLAGSCGLTIPAGKVFYYGDYNKPILYISDGKNKDYASNYIGGFGRYVVCDNTVDSIVEGINECISQLPDYQVIIPERMLPEVIAKKMLE